MKTRIPRRAWNALALLVVAALAVGPAVGVPATSARSGVDGSTALVPKGWAPRGDDAKPQSQYDADIADMRRGGCGENAALLFRVRGSGADYGGYPIKLPNGDRLGAWLIGAGQELIRRGWRVRGLQAIYPAPPIPGGVNVANPLKWKSLRDAATTAAPGIKKALVEAYERCPARSILIAGHSLGNIVLRIVLRQLPDRVLEKIVRVDLFSDPTADRAVDGQLQHPSDLDGHLTNAGADTAAARLAWKAGAFLFTGATVRNLVNFRQKPHPIPQRVFQYCVPYDVVCDVNPVNVARAIADPDRMGKIHVSYQFASVGILAARTLRNYASASPATRDFVLRVAPDRSAKLGPWVVPADGSYVSARRAYGFPSSCSVTPSSREIYAGWNTRRRPVGWVFRLVEGAPLPTAYQICKGTAPAASFDRGACLGKQCVTAEGLRTGDSVAKLLRLYPNARARYELNETRYWLVTTPQGDPLLRVSIASDRVSTFWVNLELWRR